MGLSPNSSKALGALAGGLSQAFVQKKQREYEESSQNAKLLTGLVAGGIQSGTVSDPNQAFQFLVDNLQGKKGGKGKQSQLPPQLSTMIAATQKAGADTSGAPAVGGAAAPVSATQGAPAAGAAPAGTPPGQAPAAVRADDSRTFDPKPSPPAQHGLFLSNDERAQKELDAKKKEFDQIGRPKLELESQLRVKEAEQKYKGVADKEPSQNQDGSWSRKVRAQDGTIVYEEPSQGPKPTTPLDKRAQEVAAQLGVPLERARQVAAMQLDKERGEKTKQAASRLGAYLDLSRARLLTDDAKRSEMEQAFPYVLAAKQAGIDLSLARAAAGAGNGAADPVKIVEAATKTAASLAGKQSSILTGLGLEDDEATIRTNLIRELSGGSDPQTIEAAAKERTTGAATGTGPAPARAATPKVVALPKLSSKSEAEAFLRSHGKLVTPEAVQFVLSHAGQ